MNPGKKVYQFKFHDSGFFFETQNIRPLIILVSVNGLHLVSDFLRTRCLDFSSLHKFSSKEKVYPFEVQSWGGFSHWHGIRLCACLLGRFFAKFGIAIGGFSSQTKEPKLHKFGVFCANYFKKHPIWLKLGAFLSKIVYWWVGNNWPKIGIEKVRFSTSVMYIHVQFWWKYPPPGSELMSMSFSWTCSFNSSMVNHILKHIKRHREVYYTLEFLHDKGSVLWRWVQ